MGEVNPEVPCDTTNNTPASAGGSKGSCAWMRGNNPDVQIRAWFYALNVGPLLGKSGEIAERLKRCHTDISCLQEVN